MPSYWPQPAYMAEIGRRGGLVRSERKRAALEVNIRKARLARGQKPGPRRLPTEPLTSHERELLVLLDWGCSSREIAAEMGRNVHAVRHRISILCQKFEAKTCRDAVLAARARGLVED